MDNQDNIFMSTGTVIGVALAFVLSLYIYIFDSNNVMYIPFIFIIPTLLLRSIGRLLDIIRLRKKNK